MIVCAACILSSDVAGRPRNEENCAQPFCRRCQRAILLPGDVRHVRPPSPAAWRERAARVEVNERAVEAELVDAGAVRVRCPTCKAPIAISATAGVTHGAPACDDFGKGPADWAPGYKSAVGKDAALELELAAARKRASH